MTGISWTDRQLLKIMPEKASFRAADLSLDKADTKISKRGLGGYLNTMLNEGLLEKVGREYCRMNGSSAIINRWRLSERGRKFKEGI